MNRLNRLKWIPMLVKAYSDARVKRELELRNPSVSGEEDGTGPTERASGSKSNSSSRGNGTRSKKLVQASSRNNRVQKIRHAGTNRRLDTVQPTARAAARSAKGSNWQRNYNDSYKSVLVELRETKRKLNRLESIHDQLTQMQQHLDEKLVDLVQRLESQTPDTTTAESASQSEASVKMMHEGTQ